MKAVAVLTVTPAALVSTSGPLVATNGTGTVRLVALWLMKLVVRLPVPKRTPITLSSPLPVRMIDVPAGPVAGAKLLTRWARPGKVSSNRASSR